MSAEGWGMLVEGSGNILGGIIGIWNEFAQGEAAAKARTDNMRIRNQIQRDFEERRNRAINDVMRKYDVPMKEYTKIVQQALARIPKSAEEYAKLQRTFKDNLDDLYDISEDMKRDNLNDYNNMLSAMGINVTFDENGREILQDTPDSIIQKGMNQSERIRLAEDLEREQATRAQEERNMASAQRHQGAMGGLDVMKRQNLANQGSRARLEAWRNARKDADERRYRGLGMLAGQQRQKRSALGDFFRRQKGLEENAQQQQRNFITDQSRLANQGMQAQAGVRQDRGWEMGNRLQMAQRHAVPDHLIDQLGANEKKLADYNAWRNIGNQFSGMGQGIGQIGRGWNKAFPGTDNKKTEDKDKGGSGSGGGG